MRYFAFSTMFVIELFIDSYISTSAEGFLTYPYKFHDS